MKTLLTSVLLWAFVQVLWFSLFTQTGASVDCSTFTNNAECCGSENSCAFINCTKNGTHVTATCVNAAVCPDGENATNLCTAPLPTADPCRNYTTNLTCCNSTEENCGFFSCSNTTAAAFEVCAQINATAICGDDVKLTASNNTCPAPQAPDACLSFTNLTDCCDAPPLDQCAFYSCSGAKNTTVCRKNTTEQVDICPKPETAVHVNCPGKPTTVTPTSLITSSTSMASSTSKAPPSNSTIPASTPSPTKAPSTGGGGGGHGFDGASFIGGIVLCAGLVAIGYFGLKFYRSRQERNYHTL